jgi:hypothetical protein
LGPMKLVCGWRERSPNFSESSLFSFCCSKLMRALSVDPLKLVNMTSGKSNFYLALPKLVAMGEISSLIRFLLSSFWSLPNFYSELERLRSRSLSRSLYCITRECMDWRRLCVSPGALIILLQAVLGFLWSIFIGGLNGMTIEGGTSLIFLRLYECWEDTFKLWWVATPMGLGETATSTSFSSSTVSLQFCFFWWEGALLIMLLFWVAWEL